MTFKRPESVLVVLYNEHSQVLVLQRMDDADFWQSVTGTMELNEAPIQTAIREVHEETSIKLRFEQSEQGDSLCQLIDCKQANKYTIRAKWRYRYPPEVDENLEHVFCALVPASTQIILTEHTHYLWLNKDQAIAKVWSSTNKQAIQEFVPQ